MSQENTVGERLKIFFKEKGLTQVQIAERVGTTQQVVQKLLKGRPFGKRTAAIWSKEFKPSLVNYKSRRNDVRGYERQNKYD